MNVWAVLAAAAVAAAAGGLWGIGLAVFGRPVASVFRTRTTRVRRAGAVTWSRSRALRAGSAIAVTALVWLVTGWPVGALLAGAMVAAVPFFFGGAKIAAQRIERLEALEQWVRHLADSMTAGSAPVQTIVRSADRAPLPIRPAVDRLTARLSTDRLDRNLVLRRFADDIDDALGDIVVLALKRAVNTRGGERVPQVLQTLAEAVAAEVKARRAVEKERAGPRKETQTIVVVLAVFVAALTAFTDYPKVYDSAQGQVALLVLGLFAFGSLALMRKLSIGGQPPRILAESTEAGR